MSILLVAKLKFPLGWIVLFPKLTAGALGYLSKNSSTEELFHAVRGVAMGALSISPSAIQTLLRDFRKPNIPSQSKLSYLTELELDFLNALGKGHSNQEIAEDLSIEITTVRSHISRILNKLDLDNRTQAVLYAVEMRLVQPKE
jgi:DNA-binding NarL/FixJ family response regulator